MKLDLKIHSFSHVLKSLLGNVEKYFGGLNYPANELIVVNYHSTPKKFLLQFEEQLMFYKKQFTIIDPAQLSDYYNGKLTSDKCHLLITFDDGLKNNLNAVEVMNKHKVKAFFFIVPGFIDTASTQQKEFYLMNIRPVVNPRIDNNEEDLTPLAWNEINELIQQGHMVGCHTLTHTLSVDNTNEGNSEKEILKSKSRIEEMTGVKLNSFCSINDTLKSTGALEKKLINLNYTFHFTTFPGLNSYDKDPHLIKRRNVEVFWLKGALYYALGKTDLKRWEKAIAEYRAL